MTSTSTSTPLSITPLSMDPARPTKRSRPDPVSHPFSKYISMMDKRVEAARSAPVPEGKELEDLLRSVPSLDKKHTKQQWIPGEKPCYFVNVDLMKIKDDQFTIPLTIEQIMRRALSIPPNDKIEVFLNLGYAVPEDRNDEMPGFEDVTNKRICEFYYEDEVFVKVWPKI